MESTNDLRNEYIFNNFRGRFVVINGEIYKETYDYPYVLKNVIYFKKGFDTLSILNENDQETFYQLIKDNGFIDGFRCKYGEYYTSKKYDFSYEEYKQIIKCILEKKGLRVYEEKIIHWFEPLHIIRCSEIEARYNCNTTAVINGEKSEGLWDDIESKESLFSGLSDKRPGYIVVDESQSIKSIPVKEKLHREIGHPKDGIWICVELIPKKYLEKIIVHIDHVDFSGNSTHRHERLKLDFKNPDPKVLDFMIKHGLCEKK